MKKLPVDSNFRDVRLPASGAGFEFSATNRANAAHNTHFRERFDYVYNTR